MIKRKEIIWGIFCLLFLCLVVGCSKQQKSDTTISSSSTNESSSFTSSSSTKERTKQTSSDEATKQTASEVESMNFAQIKQGDYTSLLGKWQEVATSVNNHDGKGNSWIESSGSTLLISQNQISTDYLTLEANTFSFNDGENKLVTFSEKNSYLEADSEKGAIIWNMFFYPEGVKMIDFGTEKPATIEESKARIVIRTSNNNYTQVFQKNDSADSDNQSTEKVQTTPLVMNLEEIKTGNYSSLNGMWENNLGKIIVVSDESMDFTDISNHNEPAKIVGLSLDIPSLNAADGTPKLVQYMMANEVSAYEQQLIVEDNQGILSLKSSLPGAVIYISFLPEGTTGDIIEGDASREKIVAIGTQNTATSVFKDYVYYRVE